MRGALLSVAVAAAAACGGGDVDLTGVYRVDRAVASAPCGEDRPVADPPAFLEFSRGDLFGNPFYAYVECTDAAATDCVAVGGVLEGFFEPRDDGWDGYASSASGADDDCQLRVDDRSATLDGDVLVVEEHVYREDHVALPPGGCLPDEAEARGEAMPCVAHSRMIATRLE
jgi:hypothetical protein